MQGLDRYRYAVGRVLSPQRPEHWHRRRAVLTRVIELSSKLRFARGATVGKQYLDDETTLAAYLAYFTPWNALRIGMVFGMHNGRLPAPFARRAPEDGRPIEILDLGAGPLVFELAMAMAHPELLARPVIVHAVDTSARSLEVGRAILDELAPGHRWTVKPIVADFDALCLEERLVPWPELSLVVETFSLNEWARSRYRREKLQALVGALARLAPGVEVLAIEPGNREAGRLLPALRAELIAAGSQEIIGPCTHRATCPLVRTRDRSWCHFRSTVTPPDWLVEVGRDAGLPKERLFASYLWWRGQSAPSTPPRATIRGRVLGEPMRIGREKAGIYACDVTGRVLYVWPQGDAGIVPPANGGIIERATSVRSSGQDYKSEATIYPLKPDDSGARARPGARSPRGRSGRSSRSDRAR